jgi:hypothetical protein
VADIYLHVCTGAGNRCILPLASPLKIVAMLRIGLCVALGLGVVCVVDGLDSQVPMQGRSLLQGNETTVPAKIRVANLTNVLNTTGDVLLDEQELQGSIDVTSSSEPVLYGTYFLGPSELAEINHTIATELVRFYMLLQPCVPFLLRGKMCLAKCSQPPEAEQHDQTLHL